MPLPGVLEACGRNVLIDLLGVIKGHTGGHVTGHQDFLACLGSLFCDCKCACKTTLFRNCMRLL